MTETFSDLFQDFDEGVVAEFMDEFRDAYAEIEALLLQLEEHPRDRALVDDLFRRVHSIKSNLRMVGFDSIAEFVHAVEEVLDAVRHAQLAFDKRVSEVVLLAVDRVHVMAEAAFRGRDSEELNTPAVQARLVRIARGDVAAVPEALGLLDPEREPEPEPEPAESPPPAAVAPAGCDPMQFFASLSRLLENRNLHCLGRHARLLELALDLNEEGGQPVDPRQLEAAVYLHDVGMAFLPVDPPGGEAAALRSHPEMAAQLIDGFDGWEEAVAIVRQHHECEDGSGYPRALRGDAIVPGAKILAIADAFEASTTERAGNQPRPLLRALAEINNGSGMQYAPEWVEAFNRVIKKKKVRKG